jgi:hypothetical protein
MATLLSGIDEALGALFSQWDTYTTLISLVLAGLVAHTILTAEEPDVHPFILQRQSTASRVRHEGESAVYRAPDVPEGAPLRSGLNVRRSTDPPYTAGRDGDIRDIWSKVAGGSAKSGSEETSKQKILTVFGMEHITEHDIGELSNEIAVIGTHLMKSGGRRVAVYLPNSVEFLGTLFGRSMVVSRPRLRLSQRVRSSASASFSFRSTTRTPSLSRFSSPPWRTLWWLRRDLFPSNSSPKATPP